MINQDDEKNSDEKNFFESFAELADDSSHVWYEDEDSERPETSKQHQELSWRIRLNQFRHPADPDQADEEDGDVEDSADVANQS